MNNLRKVIIGLSILSLGFIGCNKYKTKAIDYETPKTEAVDTVKTDINISKYQDNFVKVNIGSDITDTLQEKETKLYKSEYKHYKINIYNIEGENVVISINDGVLDTLIYGQKYNLRDGKILKFPTFPDSTNLPTKKAYHE